MPKLDDGHIYTKRAYYFGIIALISFLAAQGLLTLDKYARLELPMILPLILTILFLFCSIMCMYAIYKARNEHNSIKKVVATFLAIGAVVYIILLIRELFSVSH